MKKKVLLSSIATIALCLCLIAGSTFALFTSQDNVNIAVTAGEVDMVAGIAITSVESVQGNPNGTIEDENGAKYAYDYSDNAAPFNFVNGGTAEVAGAVLTIDKITPGDRINLEISGTNNSNVAIQYRYVIECLSGDDLMKGLELTINNVAIDKYMESYTSPWAPLAVGTSMTNVPITIELPVSAGNEFQKQSTEIRVLVEAVQGNAVVDTNTEPVITYYNTVATAADAIAAIADPYLPIVNITAPITDETVTISNIANKTINVNGNDVDFVVSGEVDNVTFTGIVDTTDEAPSIKVLSHASGTLIVKDSTLGTHNANSTYGAIAGAGAPNLDVVVDNCTFKTESGNKTGIYFTTLKSLTVTNSKFYNFSSWAINDNGAMNGDVVVDNCEFYNCTGVMKIQGKYAADTTYTITFTNNRLVDCQTKNSYYVDARIPAANVAVSGNKMTVGGVVTDDDVTAADLLGIREG